MKSFIIPLIVLLVASPAMAAGGQCDYVIGDVNGSGSYNGLDITYGISFFAGRGPAPMYACECSNGNTWFVSGDLNGSCDYNGLDITFGVNYLKGGPDPIPCASCPPTQSSANKPLTSTHLSFDQIK